MHSLVAKGPLLVQVKHLEKELHLFLEVSIGKQNQPTEHFQGIHLAHVIAVPDIEGVDVAAEYLAVLHRVDRKVLAEHPIRYVVLTKLHEAAAQIIKLNIFLRTF